MYVYVCISTSIFSSWEYLRTCGQICNLQRSILIAQMHCIRDTRSPLSCIFYWPFSSSLYFLPLPSSLTVDVNVPTLHCFPFIYYSFPFKGVRVKTQYFTWQDGTAKCFLICRISPSQVHRPIQYGDSNLIKASSVLVLLKFADEA